MSKLSHLLNRSALVLAVASAGVLCLPEESGAEDACQETHVVPLYHVLKMLDVFSNTKIRLNNYTSEPNPGADPESAAYKPNDSYTGFPFDELQHFDIPVLKSYPSSIYVREINSESVSLSTYGGKGVITVKMESEGYEFWTDCVGNVGCVDIGDNDVNTDNMAVQIGLLLTVEEGKIVYDADEFEIYLKGGFDPKKCDDPTYGKLCELFWPNMDNQIKMAIFNAIRSRLSAAAVREKIIEDFNTYLQNSIGIQGKLVEVTMLPDGSLSVVAEKPCGAGTSGDTASSDTEAGSESGGPMDSSTATSEPGAPGDSGTAGGSSTGAASESGTSETTAETTGIIDDISGCACSSGDRSAAGGPLALTLLLGLGRRRARVRKPRSC